MKILSLTCKNITLNTVTKWYALKCVLFRNGLTPALHHITKSAG